MGGDRLPRILVLVGTTASGKSALAIRLALHLGGEIVSADSRQVYRGLDLGAGKVTRDERALVRHHLLDVAELTGLRFTVAEYQRLATQALDEVVGRGRLAILVGGTGLYVRAIVDNPRFPAGNSDAALRTMLEQTPTPELAARLKQVDPVAAQQIDTRNPRRLVRALEVSLTSGAPFSAQRLHDPPRYEALQLGLTWPREELRRRIDARVDARLASTPSMLDEVRGLLDEGVSADRLRELGLEYRYLSRHALGEIGYEQMVSELKTAIWQFARRQLTWFRRDERIQWLDPTRPDMGEATENLVRSWSEG